MNQLYLCKPTGIILGTMSGLNYNSVNLKETVSQPWELMFEVDRYVYVDGELTETSYYKSIAQLMELYLDTEDEQVRFVIDQEPTVRIDGKQEIKTVIAHSIDAELQSKFLKLFDVNMGSEISQENLVEGDILGNPVPARDILTPRYTYNKNPYTELAIDYVQVYNNKKKKLEELLNNIDTINNSITWKDKTYSFTVESDGKLTLNSGGTQEEFVAAIEDIFIQFPRLQNDTIWGVDHTTVQGIVDGQTVTSPSNTFNQIVCKVISNIIVRDGDVYLVNPDFGYSIQDGKYVFSNRNNPNYRLYNLTNQIRDRLIPYYKNFGKQLSLLDLALEKADASGWSVDEDNIPEDVAEKYYNYTVDNQDIYSFFTQSCANSMKVVFDFDRRNKKIRIIDTHNDDEVHDTGVSITFRNLANEVNIQTSSDDGIKTKFYAKGGNDLGVYYVNFGNEYILNLDYFMNKTNEYDEYQYVSQELHDKYNIWKQYRDSEPYTIHVPTYSFNPASKIFNGVTWTDEVCDNPRAAYTELCRLYNQTILDITDMEDILPPDPANIDYTTYTFEELQDYWIAFNNAFDAIIMLIKEDCGADSIDYTNHFAYKNGQIVADIRDTIYWYEYIAYLETILPNVKNAIIIYVKPNADGSFPVDSEGKIIPTVGGNPDYNGDATIVTENTSNAYKYDMTLYGLHELNALKKTWLEVAAQLARKKISDINPFIKSGEVLGDIAPTFNTYSDLTVEQQSKFGSEEKYKEELAAYLDYVSPTVRGNRLVHGARHGEKALKELEEKIKKGEATEADLEQTKGVIYMAQDSIKICEATIEQIKAIQTNVDEQRDVISQEIMFEHFHDNLFTNEDLEAINILIREADYSNENILITNLNNIVDTIDKQEELYVDAHKRLFEKSRPQYSFIETMDNLLALPEFNSWHSSISLLNYIYLVIGLYDHETVRMRIVGLQKNPMIPSELIQLEFSNMIYTYDGLSDEAHLFAQNMGVSTGGTSGTTGGTSGAYGENDADIAISNNILNALLKNRTYIGNFESAIQTVKNNLRAGDVIINGECLADTIKSTNYKLREVDDNGNPVQPVDEFDLAEGSIWNLRNGLFNIGAGALKFVYENGNYRLHVSGTLDAADGIFTGIITASRIESMDGSVIIDLGQNSFQLGTSGITYYNNVLTIPKDVVIDSINNGVGNEKISGDIVSGGELKSRNYTTFGGPGNMIALNNSNKFSLGNGVLNYDGVNLNYKPDTLSLEHKYSASDIGTGNYDGETITLDRGINEIKITAEGITFKVGNDTYLLSKSVLDAMNLAINSKVSQTEYDAQIANFEARITALENK